MINTETERAIDPLTGIIRWVSEIPLEPGEPEIFNCSVKMCDSSKFLPVGCYDRNGGAGLTWEAAYRAAVGEAIERYCCSVFFPDELIFGPADKVRSVARPFGGDRMALFHPRQFDSVRYSRYAEDLPLPWTSGYSLTANEPVLVPAGVTFVPYYPFSRGEHSIGPGITTGQSCAFSYGDAALRGLYEVIERDAFMITWMNRLPVPRIDIDSSPRLARIFGERFARPGLQYSLHSLATDTGVPSILCIVIDVNRLPPMICTGGASDLDPEKAATKAIVEAAQTREWAKFLSKRKEPFIFENDYSNIDDFDKHVLLYACGDMLSAVKFLIEAPKCISFDDLRTGVGVGVKAELAFLRHKLEAMGHELVLVDLTTEDVRECGYRVVKMFVSDMQQLEGEHSHRMLGGTRLYEVPRILGYDINPSFDSLNPDPHPYP